MMKNTNFIILIIAILALLELGAFASVGFVQSYKNVSKTKQSVSVSEIAPAALSGKWKLIK